MLAFKCDAAFEQGVKDLAKYENLSVSAVIRRSIRLYIKCREEVDYDGLMLEAGMRNLTSTPNKK